MRLRKLRCLFLGRHRWGAPEVVNVKRPGRRDMGIPARPDILRTMTFCRDCDWRKRA